MMEAGLRRQHNFFPLRQKAFLFDCSPARMFKIASLWWWKRRKEKNAVKSHKKHSEVFLSFFVIHQNVIRCRHGDNKKLNEVESMSVVKCRKCFDALTFSDYSLISINQTSRQGFVASHIKRQTRCMLKLLITCFVVRRCSRKFVDNNWELPVWRSQCSRTLSLGIQMSLSSSHASGIWCIQLMIYVCRRYKLRRVILLIFSW